MGGREVGWASEHWVAVRLGDEVLDRGVLRRLEVHRGSSWRRSGSASARGPASSAPTSRIAYPCLRGRSAEPPTPPCGRCAPRPPYRRERPATSDRRVRPGLRDWCVIRPFCGRGSSAGGAGPIPTRAEEHADDRVSFPRHHKLSNLRASGHLYQAWAESSPPASGVLASPPQVRAIELEVELVPGPALVGAVHCWVVMANAGSRARPRRSSRPGRCR